MAIYLDEQTGPYLKMLLKREIKRLNNNFVAERLLKSLEADDERKAKVNTCRHDYQPLYGYKEECISCGGKKNGFEIFSSERLSQSEYQSIGDLGEGERTTHLSKDNGNTAPSTLTKPDGPTLL